MLSTMRVAGLAAAATLLGISVPAAAQAAPGAPITPVAIDAPAVAPIALPPVALAIQDPATGPASAATNPQAAAPTESPARRSLDDLVAEHGDLDTADAQFECLASAVYFEARGEPLEGQLAVAEVILNRVASGRFRATVCDVVTQPSQFSFVRRGRIPPAPRGSAAWQRAVAIAHIAMENLHDVTGDDSLFFHATYVRPSWGRADARIARIGRHVFYR